MKAGYIFIFLLCYHVAISQNNFQSSVVKVLPFWKAGDKKNYGVSYDKIFMNDKDTIQKSNIAYDVEIVVVEATATDYTIQWTYKNTPKANNLPWDLALICLQKDVPFLFKIDRSGMFQGLVNWNEIKSHVTKNLQDMVNQFKRSPDTIAQLNLLAAKYDNKTTMEAAAIKEIRQFHAFYGGEYSIGNVKQTTNKYPTGMSTVALDTYITYHLDKVEAPTQSAIFSLYKSINPDQLKATTHSFMTRMANKTKRKPPAIRDMDIVKSENYLYASIHKTGWINYSYQTILDQLGTFKTIDNITIFYK